MFNKWKTSATLSFQNILLPFDPTYLSTVSTNNEEDRLLIGPGGFLYDADRCRFVLVTCIKDATAITTAAQVMYTHADSRYPFLG